MPRETLPCRSFPCSDDFPIDSDRDRVGRSHMWASAMSAGAKTGFALFFIVHVNVLHLFNLT